MDSIVRLFAVVFCALASTASAQAIYGSPAAPIVVAQSGAAVTNTGIGTAEVNMASIAIPPLGPNDVVRVITLWDTTGSVIANNKAILVRLGTSGCAVLSACSTGTAFLNFVMTGSSAVADQTLTIIRNAGATNAQIALFTGNSTGLGATAAASSSGSVETKSGSFLNIDSQDATASTDTIKLLGYTVEVIRGH